MANHIDTRTISRFFDLLNHVEGSLKDLVPQFKAALDQIKTDFKVEESDTYIRTYRAIGELQDLAGHLGYLRTARNSANDVTISLPAELADKFVADDVKEAIFSAASALKGLDIGLTDGHMRGTDPFFSAVLRLTGHALTNFYENEACRMDEVSEYIRQVQHERDRHNGPKMQLVS